MEAFEKFDKNKNREKTREESQDKRPEDEELKGEGIDENKKKADIKETLKSSPFFEGMTPEEQEQEIDRIYEEYFESKKQ